MGRITRTFLLALIFCFIYPVLTHCQEKPIIYPQPSLALESIPLNEYELREILGRLQELQYDRAKIKQYEAFIERDRQQDAREAALNAKALELAQKDKEATERERDAWKRDAEFYKSEYEILAKKRGGAGCTLLKVVTLWLASCGG